MIYMNFELLDVFEVVGNLARWRYQQYKERERNKHILKVEIGKNVASKNKDELTIYKVNVKNNRIRLLS